jgi:hypothetical protein
MKKFIYSLAIIALSAQFTLAQKIKVPKIKDIKTPITTKTATTSSGLSESEIVEGLKEALIKSSTKASDSLNKPNAFNLSPKIRIPFPEDCKKVADELRKLGYGKKVDDFELQLNRAAEQSAKEAAPIFKGAVQKMSFSDAKGILTGADTAATAYLRKTTYDSLSKAFSPHVKDALDQTTATKMWSEIATLYNKIPTTRNKVQTDLVKYTTGKALKGVFTMVAEEELKIRKDPLARTSDILKKVFGSQK